MSGFTQCLNISIYLLIFFLLFLESTSLWISPYDSQIGCGTSWSPLQGISSLFKPGSTICLELNTKTKTLHFFVDNTQLSVCITNINTTPLSFGISAYNTLSSSVEIISFLLLKKASVDNNIKYAEYKWK
jgi:hypothetical protein